MSASDPPETGAVPVPGMALADLLVIRDQTDEKGRLLLEDAAPKRARRKAFKAGVPMKAVGCPYQDTPSRVGGLMNQPAYEALRHDTAEVLNAFAWLTVNQRRRTSSPPGTVRALFDTSYLGLTVPLLLFFRATEPVALHGRMPSYVASLFKASRGVFSAAVDLLNRLGPTTTITEAEVVRFADAEGHLIRAETQRACAAPTRLIERTLAVALTGDGADADASGLADLVDFDTLWAFYRLQDGFSEALSTYRFHYGSHLAQTLEPGSGPFGDATRSLLRQANDTQRELNRILGRHGDGPTLDFDDLLTLL